MFSERHVIRIRRKKDHIITFFGTFHFKKNGKLESVCNELCKYKYEWVEKELLFFFNFNVKLLIL